MFLFSSCALALSLCTTLGTPFLLAKSRWTVHYPRLALGTWLTALTLGCFGILSAAVTLLLAAATFTTPTTPGFHSVGELIVYFAGWALLAFIGIFLALLVNQANNVWRAERQEQQEFLRFLQGHPTKLSEYRNILVVHSPVVAATACAVSNGTGLIFLNSDTTANLTTAQLRAVLEHERTHLVHRHHLILLVARVQAALLPALPAAAQLEQSSQLLCELIADDAAARRCGGVHTANALLRTAWRSKEVSLQLRAQRIATKTWRPVRKLKQHQITTCHEI